ncbi:SAICAR synthase-like protein [Amylocystis lapponica]|nr:SAICAR synthase-like protein [Amylocystis lapponica]
MSASPSPSPFPSQVGGHPGVLMIEDGSLLIKPAAPLEVAFYQALLSDPAMALLRPYVPQFYGTLRLEGRMDTQAARTDIGGLTAVEDVPDDEKDECIRCSPAPSVVLENLSHPFLRANILDAKLGTLLYDEDASPEKRARMQKAALRTTSGETGVRLTGFQIYDLATDTPLVVPREYGRSLTVAGLPDGIERFFPLAQDPPASPSDPPADGTLKTGTGLPADVLLPLLAYVRGEVADIRAALAAAPVRMIGASLLIVYEADCTRAREGLRAIEERASRAEEDSKDQMQQDARGGGKEDEDDDGDGDDDDDDDSSAGIGAPYAVKLIDFAHTRIVPGGDTDTGVLHGLDTFLGLLDGRIEQIRGSGDVGPL